MLYLELALNDSEKWSSGVKLLGERLVCNGVEDPAGYTRVRRGAPGEKSVWGVVSGVRFKSMDVV